MNKPQGNPEIYDAIQQRGILYLTTFQELKKRYGEEEAVNIMRGISHAHGVRMAKTLTQFAPCDFEGVCKHWVMTPDEGAMYKPDIRRLDETGIEAKMMACPLKDAWTEAGCSDDEICTLLHCAAAYDYALWETAGFDFELELWSPGKDGCCLTRIKAKS